MTPSLDLTLIFPCFNESLRLPRSIQYVQQELKKRDIIAEIIIVDDGSHDDTALIAKQLNITLISYSPNRGKGYAVNAGMKIARGTFCLFMDADLATDLSAISNFLDVMKAENIDILIGDRSTINQQHSQPWLRRLLGKCFVTLTQIILGIHYNDINCGFKMFKRASCAMIFKRQRIHRWAFDAELLFIAHKNHLRVKELPVVWKHQPQSKVRLLPDMCSSLWGLITIRINDWQGLY